MNPYCRLASLSVALAAITILRAAPKPLLSKTGDKAPIPVSFSASPIHFPVDGKEHRPILTVHPSDATYAVEGTTTEKRPGRYVFTAKGTGRFAGSMTCQWTIDAPRHAPKKAPKPAPETLNVQPK